MKKKGKSIKARRVWRVNPRTRVVESKKRYSRKRAKRELSKIRESL